MRIAAATSIDWMLPAERNVGFSALEDDDEGDEPDESGPLGPEPDVLHACRPGFGLGLGGLAVVVLGMRAPLPRVPAMRATLVVGTVT